MDKQVRVGVGVLLFNEDRQLLLGLRKSKHGENSWSPPGGHLEYGESFAATAVREVKEETGIDIDSSSISVCGVTNDFFSDSGKHYITVLVRAGHFLGDPKVMEPDKCHQWQWFGKENMPDNLFLPLQNFLDQNPDIFSFD